MNDQFKKNVIAVSGAHGTGKSTRLSHIVDDLLLDQSATYKTIWLIDEVARRCPFPVLGKSSQSSLFAQYWMLATHMKEEMDAAKKYDVVVSDRSIVDYCAYLEVTGYPKEAWAAIEYLGEYVWGMYQKIEFLRIKDNDYLVDDGFRSIDLEMRQKVEDIMLKMYSYCGIHF